jgi:type IX secretion system PorP/SprF family membrane protein
MKRLLFIALAIFNCVKAQDIHFTQFHAAPLYLNPALTGSNTDSRIATIYRNQWWNIPGTYNSFLLSYDQNIPDLHSAAGIMLVSDNAGSMNFGLKGIGLSYAYEYKINYDWTISSGIRVSYFYNSLDFSKLIFGDQLLRGASSSLQPVLPNKSSYLDFSFGTITFNNEHLVGFSIDHINRPVYSFIGYNSRLPIKFSFHLIKTFHVFEKYGSGKKDEKPVLLGLFQYKFQEKFDQIDIGCVYKKESYFLGVFYRGIPWLKYYKKGYPNNDAIAILGGIKYKNIQFAYSYDLTISWQTYKTGGSNEFSLIYNFYNPQKVKKQRAKIIPCAKF